MEQNRKRIQEAGLGVAAISYDSVAVLTAFSERQHITFPLLSDPQSAIIRRYGIFNDTVQKTSPTYGIPYPGVYVLDAQGRVTAKYFEDDYKQRDTAALILMRNFGISAPDPHTSIAAKHLQIAAVASEEEVGTGQKMFIALNLDLPPNMHVYAPGVTGYIPIDWNMDQTPGATIGTTEYPASTSMLLEAIHETVPVFQGHVQLLRPVTIGNPSEIKPILDVGGVLTLVGTFRYQACDDTTCYNPETVPVSWKLKVTPLDRVRVSGPANK